MLRHLFIVLFFLPAGLSSKENKTQRNIDSLSTLLKKDLDDTNKVIHLNELCSSYQSISNYDTALVCGTAALQLAEHLNYKRGIAMAHNRIGIAYKYLGNYDKALENHFASLKLREELGEKKGIAGSYNNIGEIHRLQGNYSEAIKFFFLSLQLKEAIGEIGRAHV